MGEVIRFISKAERERIRLIREARAIYDGVFPPSDFVDEQRDKTPVLEMARPASDRTVVRYEPVGVV
jgi:hypothetical protein